MADADRIATLEKSVENLSRRLQQREDELDIRKLQHLYGYLIDKCLYNETVDLFTDDGEVHFFGGIWKGKEGIRRLYVERFQKRFTHGTNGPIDGFLLDHPQLQDIIDVEPNGEIAHARARSMMQAGRHKDYTDPSNPMLGARQWWEGGIYENEYVKDNGIWKIKVLDYNPLWHGMFEKGWAHQPANAYPFSAKTYPEDPLGPDVIAPEAHRRLWPETPLVPFHYPHPVTGEPMVPEQPEQWRAK